MLPSLGKINTTGKLLETVFVDGAKAGQDVLPGHFGLEDVRRAGKKAGRAESIDRPLCGAIDIIGARERHRRLRTDPPRR